MKIIKRFFELEKKDKIIFFLSLNTIINFFIALTKITLSLTIPSLWFFINGIFMLTLTFSRFLTIKNYKIIKLAKDEKTKQNIENKTYIHSAILLIFLGIIYYGVSVYMYYKITPNNMHEYLTYLVALVAFYSISSTIYGIIKYKKKDIMLLSIKYTNIANALTSIALTQVVLLSTFGNSNDYRLLNSITGMCSSIIIIIVGLYMIINKKRKEKL